MSARHDQVQEALARDLKPISGKSFVILLGDNIYPVGLPAPDSPEFADKQERLARQITYVTSAGARGAMVPGNHDWAKSGADGLEAVLREGKEANRIGNGLVTFHPAGGCPGPDVIDQGPFRIVLIDTEWFLRDAALPRGGPDCAAGTDSTAMDLLEKALATAGKRQVIVSGHHPLGSGGVHGGHFGFKDHVFSPHQLREMGLAAAPDHRIALSVGPGEWYFGAGHEEQAKHRGPAGIEAAFRKNPPLVYAAGHEHNLQVLAGTSARWFVVSGAGYYGHHSRTSWLDSTRFAVGQSGYVRLDATRAGRVRVGVITVDETSAAHEEYSAWLH